MFLGKTVFHIRQKGVPPLLLPASVLQSPRCLVWIYNLFLILQLYLNLKVSKNAIAAEKPYCKFSICFANVGYSPTPRQHFWKIAGSKNFSFACGSLLTANHPKKQLLLSKKSLLFLQNIPKIKWFVAKLFHTFYSQNFIIFLFSVVCINCFYSIRCVFNTSKIIDYWLLINNCL